MTLAENVNAFGIASCFTILIFQPIFFSSHFGKNKFKPFPLDLLLNTVSAFKQFVKQNFSGKYKIWLVEVLQKLKLQDFKKLPLLYGKF